MGQKQTKLTTKWADSPFPLIESPAHRDGKIPPRWGATNFATEMSIIHNHIIRALNTIYIQSSHLTPTNTNTQTITDFTTYMHAFLLFIHEHHTLEETLFFPWLEEYIGIPNYMHPNVEQHHSFAAGLAELGDYVKLLRKGDENGGDGHGVVFDGEKVRRIIDGFGEVLIKHLRDEIVSLEGLEEFGAGIDWETLNKRITAYAVANANTEFVIPMILTSGDVTWEGGMHKAYWPPFPWYAMLIFKWVYIPKHKGAWRFGCSSVDMVPRDLALGG